MSSTGADGFPADVFVLGAGFSKSVSSHMPLTRSLFDPCVEMLRAMGAEAADDATALSPYARFGSDVETWLTWLGSDQPWLSESDLLRNQAAFAEVARALATVILRAQNRAAATAPPNWLHLLVKYWANRSATIITLNYDTLVEKMYETLVPGIAAFSLYSLPLADLKGAGQLGGDVTFRFDMFKLHGSIGWYVFPRGAASPIYDAGLAQGWTGAPDDEASLTLRVGGRLPLIVPPVVGKDPYYTRPELRDQWLRADYRLQQADRLFLLGYSLPEADLTMRFLLDRAKGSCEVFPVTTNVEAAERIESLLRPRPCNKTYAGRAEAIEEFAAWYTAAQAG